MVSEFSPPSQGEGGGGDRGKQPPSNDQAREKGPWTPRFQPYPDLPTGFHLRGKV